MPSTEKAHGGICLRAPYAKSGTELASDGTRAMRCAELSESVWGCVQLRLRKWFNHWQVRADPRSTLDPRP
eukprot:2550200-Rhodomonas_salina.2